jgi:hypothetical protein
VLLGRGVVAKVGVGGWALCRAAGHSVGRLPTMGM